MKPRPSAGMVDDMFGDDATSWMGLLCREVLRERTADLVAEACAWAVGLSDRRHYLLVRGQLVETGGTVADRVATGQPLSGEESGRLDLGEVRPGSFADALNAVGADGVLAAERFDIDVLEPFVLATCLLAAERARRDRPLEWADLLHDLGEDAGDDGVDLADVVRVGEWEVPLRIEAEHLVLAAIGHAPLLEVEAEGLPLSLVRGAEALTREAAGPVPEPVPAEASAGAVFLAQAAVAAGGLADPVPASDADRLLVMLLAEGIEPAELPAVLGHLSLAPGTADAVRALLSARP